MPNGIYTLKNIILLFQTDNKIFYRHKMCCSSSICKKIIIIKTIFIFEILFISLYIITYIHACVYKYIQGKDILYRQNPSHYA